MRRGKPSMPPPPTPDRRESQELSSVFCLCDSSALSDENVPLFRAWNMLSRETLARPILLWASALQGRGEGGGGYNLLKWLITMWKWNPLRDFSTSKFQPPSFAIVSSFFLPKHVLHQAVKQSSSENEVLNLVHRTRSHRLLTSSHPIRTVLVSFPSFDKESREETMHFHV